MLPTLTLLALLGPACTWITDTDREDALDPDGDGFSWPEDCDNENAEAFPGADEVCDGVDNDCDDEVDEADALDAWTGWADGDGDGWGDPASPLVACTQPTGAVDNDGDCDDTQDQVNPDEPEVCNDVDDDCDGVTDGPGASDALTGYTDADGDGWGDPASPVTDCELPADAVTDDTDCDDTDPDVYPGASDATGDNLDANCDGQETCYQDSDGDGWRVDVEIPSSDADCADPGEAAASAAGGDCDDASPDIHPSAAETPGDGVDQDCDEVDLCYEDLDGDGYRTSSTRLSGDLDCDDVLEASSDDFDGDCDDLDGAAWPGAPETVGDGVDQSCDGTESCYEDLDGDGYRTETTRASDDLRCDGSGEASSTTPSGDCDDSVSTVFPGAAEVCDGVDQDCDGATDDGADAEGATPWYADADADGWGDLATEVMACVAPAGTIRDGSDCDDAQASVHPGAEEVCNDVDDNCDGDTDSDAIDRPTAYRDADGDGWGTDLDLVVTCGVPEGYLGQGGDCDDTLSAVSPEAVEVCNDTDDDCDGAVDTSATDAPTWYTDADGDSFGADATITVACDAPEMGVNEGGDCDDALATVYPGAEEVCDGVDQDCDGEVDSGAVDSSTWYNDSDGDGWGDVATATLACEGPVGWLVVSGDCDDTDGSRHPEAEETVGDGADQDCDGLEVCYADADGDGYRTDLEVVSLDASCDDPGEAFASAETGDCDDSSTDVYPGGTESCDEIDNDCDAIVDESDALDAFGWYLDTDGDGHGSPGDPTFACWAPSGYAASSDDCDDADPGIHPDAMENPGDDIDQDCDGMDGCTDLNCDGWPDIVFSNMQNDGAYNVDSVVYYGSPTGFNTYVNLPTSGARGNTIADLDRDGWPDIVFSNFYNGSSTSINSYVYWGSSAGFSELNRTDLATNTAVGNTVADLDADGWPDIIFANASATGSYVYWGSATGYSASALTVLPTTNAHDVAAADLDGDTLPDLAFAIEYSGGPGPSRILFNDGHRFTDPDETELYTFYADAVTVADIDQDGWADVVYVTAGEGSYSSYIYWNDLGTFSESHRTDLPTVDAKGVTVADLDLNGYNDVLFANYYGPTWSIQSYVYYGSSEGFSTSRRGTWDTRGACAVAVDDLDLDGFPDVVFANAYDTSTYNIDSYVYLSAGARIDLPTHGARDVSTRPLSIE